LVINGIQGKCDLLYIFNNHPELNDWKKVKRDKINVISMKKLNGLLKLIFNGKVCLIFVLAENELGIVEKGCHEKIK
jgi:hypothetical protein